MKNKYLIAREDRVTTIFKVLKISESYIIGNKITLDSNFNTVMFRDRVYLGEVYVRNTFKPYSATKYNRILPLAEVAEKINGMDHRIIFSKILEIL